MGNIILKCNNLSKSFGKRKILKNVTFSINKGDILGFIGPNGSGKTTTIKCILGLNKIDSGNVYINDYNIENNFEKAIEKVGCIVENPDLYMYLTGRQNLKLIASMYNNIDKSRINEVINIVGLSSRINDKVSKYSLGMRQRLGIAQALLHNPNLLIFDEPTNGLDPEGIKDLRTLLKELADNGMAILISSHNLSELESFCNKICIIKNGTVIETNDVTSIKREKKSSIYEFEIDDTSKLKDTLENFDIINDKIFEITIEKEDIPFIIKELVKREINIYGVNEKTLTLEEAFLNKTGGNKID
ncbi:MAG: ABC transporter ATP-binding protein [bacterium]|nr:ABC transporter ATP-binding protein [bacterium]